MIVNASSIVQHGIQIKNGIMMNDNASVNSVLSAKKIIVGILAYEFARMVSV